MPLTCSLSFCKSTGRNSKGLSFHEFPSDPIRRQQWLEAVSRHSQKPCVLFQPCGANVICSKHFTSNDFRDDLSIRKLKKNACPSVFEENPVSCKEEVAATTGDNAVTEPICCIQEFDTSINTDTLIKNSFPDKNKSLTNATKVTVTETVSCIQEVATGVDGATVTECVSRRKKSATSDLIKRQQLPEAIPSGQETCFNLQSNGKNVICCKPFTSHDLGDDVKVQNTTYPSVSQDTPSDLTQPPAKRRRMLNSISSELTSANAPKTYLGRCRSKSSITSTVTLTQPVSCKKEVMESPENVRVTEPVSGIQEFATSVSAEAANRIHLKKKSATSYPSGPVTEPVSGIMEVATSIDDATETEPVSGVQEFAISADSDEAANRIPLQKSATSSPSISITEPNPHTNKGAIQRTLGLCTKIEELKREINNLKKVISRRNAALVRIQENTNIIQEELNLFKEDPYVTELENIKKGVVDNKPQAMFLLDMIVNFNKKCPRYSEFTLDQCVAWRKKSPEGYAYARKFNILKLPGPSTLLRYMEQSSAEAGIAPYDEAVTSCEDLEFENS